VTFHSMGAELGSEGPQLYVLKDKTHEGEIIDKNFFLRDGHDSYSPDRNWMLYDSYPDNEGYRHLYLYNLNKKKGIILGSYYSYPNITGDFRCDLHPRWNRSGNAISFDSIHEGHRHIYYMDLKEIMDKI
jgi:Tol biopolymer transport system component